MTFVVDARLCHAGSDNSAEGISDIVAYLLADYSFLSRKSLCRVFKLCCLVMRRPRCDFSAVVFSLNDCVVPESVVTSCLRGVQSYVCSPSFKVGSLFTQRTMESVRDAISSARNFMVSSSEFGPWARVCTSDRSAFVLHYSELFSAHLDRKKEASYQRFRTANQRIRSDGTGDSRAVASSVSSGGRPGLEGSVVSRGGKTSTERPSQQSSGASSVASTSSKGGSKNSKRQSGSKKN